MTQHILGVGFSSGLVDGTLQLPPGFSYVEAGFEFLSRHETPPPLLGCASELKWSLHLSRAPFCEAPSIQDAFVESLARGLPSYASSVGVHLCGPYRSGLGRLGLGSDFLPTPENIVSAQRLARVLQQTLPCGVLIENASYYPDDRQTALQTTTVLNELCQKEGPSMILDLAHLIMCSRNCGIEPHYLLGRVNLTQVAVVHLSGIHESSSGVLHDGHSYPVHLEVWELFETTLRLLKNDVSVVLEHTDEAWASRPQEFEEECRKLAGLCHAQPKQLGYKIDVERAGLGYMANIVLPRCFPALRTRLGEQRFRSLVHEWGENYLSRTVGVEQSSFTTFRCLEAEYLGDQSVSDPIQDFREFCLQLSEGPHESDRHL